MNLREKIQALTTTASPAAATVEATATVKAATSVEATISMKAASAESAIPTKAATAEAAVAMKAAIGKPAAYKATSSKVVVKVMVKVPETKERGSKRKPR